MKKFKIKYCDLFWLFILSSWFGVILEGFYCLIKFGKWESHVVSIFGHFCIIYGFGTVLYYISCNLCHKLNIFLKFLIYAVVGTFVELMCGLLLDYGLGMYAWSYANSFMNYHGYICLFMFIVWGLFGLLFEYFLPLVNKLLGKLHHKIFSYIVPFFTTFMILNLVFTGICIYRWSLRHKNIQSHNSFERYIDKKYNDDYMAKRFMEWHFNDEKN